ncbi:thioredoxin-like protein AAED1, chloroplastic isoform X2 [Tripterygium wilfordii]|uniref:thioredoxin-like protein AAED1, chloroplastic isoform X2 n=1 Tax=Tripterygium wilfordii TaxID=458696 RepID=UPI0018F8097E|nr:thioredoxin-like protein AAED1, chloroplastic isoform X2 [Tripterygium wilfordii]
MAMSFLPNRLHHHPTHVLPNPPQILSPRLSFFSLGLGRCNNSIRVKIPPRQSRLNMLQIAASSLSGIESSGFPGEDITVFDLNGNGIPISDLWKDRKAVVAFARHFGCVLCRKRADYLASKKDVMDASGVSLVLVGPGSIDQAKAFYEQTKFEGEIYADPSHASYRALRFVSGVSTTFTPKAGLKIIKSYMEGYRQDWKLSFERDTVARGGWYVDEVVAARWNNYCRSWSKQHLLRPQVG